MKATETTWCSSKPIPTGSAPVRLIKTLGRSVVSQRGYYRLKKGLRSAMCLTGAIRVLPDFLVIGAQKSGSSSLFYYLQQHPDVCLPLNITKEIHYFDRYYHRGERWYRGHFPLWATFRLQQTLSSNRLITGEATPEYLVHPRAPERIACDLPHVRCIAVLRNPIDRAFSHYNMEIKRTAERRSFEEAVEPELTSGPIDLGSLTDTQLARWNRGLNTAYLTRGIYIDQIRRWQSLFPSKQLLVLLAEELFEKPKESYQALTEFLGIPFCDNCNYININPGAYGNKMGEDTRDRLKDFFRLYNTALSDWFGRPVDWS